MNTEILQRLSNFERRGREFKERIAQSLTQASVSDLAKDMLIDAFLPYGSKGMGRQVAKVVSPSSKSRMRTGLAIDADNWLNEITYYLNRVSKLSPTLTEKGNSEILVRKFIHAKTAKKAETKIDRGIKVLQQLQTYDLVYNSEIKRFLDEKKLQATVTSEYRDMANEVKRLLKDHSSMLKSILGAIERIETGGIDSDRQALSSCRNAVENLIKEVSGENDWKAGLKIVVPSETRQKTIKQTHRFLSAYGAHGKDTTPDDAKSGLEQTMSAIRIILSGMKEMKTE